ncbi:hypothetical protein OG21DRAFT_1513897 [Imleria badia]|nr:hypothetical protein OG21DRAFT_1513897 [Imleria badia]
MSTINQDEKTVQLDPATEGHKQPATQREVQGIQNVVKAHSHAFEATKLPHRDISTGNIILKE